MVALVNENVVDISANKNALMTEIDKKIAGSLLSSLNDDFDNAQYPVIINRAEILQLLDGIDTRLRRSHQLNLQFFHTLDHDFICGISSHTRFGVKCTFTLPGSAIQSEFSTQDRFGYAELVNAAFQDFVLTMSSLLENLVRLKETLVRKVIVNSPKRRAQAGTETMHLYMEFLKILVKLEYRSNDDFHRCLSQYEVFFDKYLMPLYKLRGSIIHGYRENISANSTGVYVVRRIDGTFTHSNAELMVDQFVDHIYENIESFTIELIDYLSTKLSDPAVKIPM